MIPPRLPLPRDPIAHVLHALRGVLAPRESAPPAEAPRAREDARGPSPAATSRAGALRTEAQAARALRGGADADALPTRALRITWFGRPQLNANHPEILTRYDEAHAITASSFPKGGKAVPEAHLDQALRGDASVFASHQNRTGRDLFQNIVLHNPGAHPVTVRVDALASNHGREAGYRDLGASPSAQRATLADMAGRAFNGPGDRTADQILRGRREGPATITIPPGGTAVLHAAQHPASTELVTQAQIHASGPVHAAVLYTPDALHNDARGVSPRAAQLMQKSGLVHRSHHDNVPSPPGARRFIFGRVAGVVDGSTGKATLTSDGSDRFSLDPLGTTRFAFLTKATRKVDEYDSAGALRSRYADSAYANHGSYGADLHIALPLENPASSSGPRRVRVYLDTPPERNHGGVSRSIRNSIAATVDGVSRFFNLNQRAGSTSATPLVDVTLAPGERADAKLRMVHAANNTPPYTVRVVVSAP